MKKIILGVALTASGLFSTILIPNAVIGLIVSMTMFGIAALIAFGKGKNNA